MVQASTVVSDGAQTPSHEETGNMLSASTVSPDNALPQRVRRQRNGSNTATEESVSPIIDVERESKDDNIGVDDSVCESITEDEDLNAAADQAAKEAGAIARARFIYMRKLKTSNATGRNKWNKYFMKSECLRLNISFPCHHLLKIAQKLAAAATKFFSQLEIYSERICPSLRKGG